MLSANILTDASKFLIDYGNLSIIYFIESKIDKKTREAILASLALVI